MFRHREQPIRFILGMMMIISGLVALIMAWFFQNIWNMAPCGLCLLERWPYRILILFGIFVFIVKNRFIGLIFNLAALVLLASLALSFLHIGVEQGWWPSPLPECYSISSHVQDLNARFMSMPDRPSKPCDIASYLFDWLPISLTMLNGLYSLVLFIAIIVGTRMRHRPSSFS
ncbi:disulfide bond formation protein B [Commensalibacter oyaizuii]|uniref:Disulfide bond formation protein B n=1 Tax=Commensalibacter oyaizuii TaxID=3043873 RepID=A0ABT6Q1J3_9PROT|nr:disulfide bond formation protein B [Commensalibacter sp. TBRC 16381]MDI2090880.1 disulfide bond formation protein B [Commensalibacter sp. TBRC 16381]